NIDIREHGSGNLGTTNALRVLGKKAGIITYIGDCLKAIIAGLVVRLIFGESHASMIKVLILYTGLGTVLGHNFPFYLKFKGGKGIAATSGMMLSFDLGLSLLGFITFTSVGLISKYVSLASLSLMVGFLIELIVIGQTLGYNVDPIYLKEIYALGAILTGLAFYKHKDNIKRLLNGTENKFGKKTDK
ncbi:MAG: glycerol-3-phosphate acyltransferase, partial [Clostridiales bacterium]|nr:glycerol-3-phosphate acyltransferase [Clostridiales bacterium]